VALGTGATRPLKVVAAAVVAAADPIPRFGPMATEGSDGSEIVAARGKVGTDAAFVATVRANGTTVVATVVGAAVVCTFVGDVVGGSLLPKTAATDVREVADDGERGPVVLSCGSARPNNLSHTQASSASTDSHIQPSTKTR
jgi:hypothetical protein